MPKHYRTGLVVGKFSPLHSGHRYLIDTATAACDQLLILSYSRPEFAGCTSALRQQWLNNGWPQHQTRGARRRAGLPAWADNA
ncbi:adenylyltransferase/cytidyltransferase family protein [Halopseudomonas pachastrellae]|nr:adenylyltransferase/cytidyltransferase family protein [Halopseudomonas pachastrellae]